jgi:chemosensory pili system protein ChpC
MAESEEIPAFVVSLQKSTILLPNSSVAEIIPYEPLQRVGESPDWFLGLLGWRGVQVPVVSFEMLTLRGASFSLVSVSSASLVVVRGVTASEEMPYFALVSQTLPRLVRVREDMLFESAEEAQETEVIKARLADEVVSLPNVDYIETAIRGVGYAG